MAYMRDIEDKCASGFCKSRATVEVFDRWNNHHGNYCRKCGAARIKQLKRVEDEDDKFMQELEKKRKG